MMYENLFKGMVDDDRRLFGNLATARIQLQGAPYQQVDQETGDYIDCTATLERLVQSSGYPQTIEGRIQAVEPFLAPLISEAGYYTVDKKLKHGQPLSFAESFSAGVFVISALNRHVQRGLVSRATLPSSLETHLLQATALLSALSVKESYVGLTAEEIAGLVAATVHLDTVARPAIHQLCVGFGGMGGDVGYIIEGSTTKLFNTSTLGATVLSAQLPVHKHHSYPNTSKVAGQSAIEAYGARSDFYTIEAMERIFAESNLLMTSCHNTRTLHTLSHLLRGETINHVIGPLAFTIAADSPIQAMIGVNEKVHPKTITRALSILAEAGFQQYANSAVYAGTNVCAVDKDDLDENIYQNSRLKQQVVLDEVAAPPFVTVVGFLRDGQATDTYMLYPEDFFAENQLEGLSLETLQVPNEREAILTANIDALCGNDMPKTRYLAMTVGLGLFVHYMLSLPDALDCERRRVNQSYLRDCTQHALELLVSGKGREQLQRYVEITKLYAGGRL